jgi:large repetitive protein
MTHARSAPRPGFALLFLLLVSALPSLAQSTPTLKLADDSGNSVTITAAGAVCTGACSGDLLVSPGSLTWTGTIGAFTVSNANGRTRPALTAPNIDVGTGTITTGAAGGTLTITWSDTGFFGSGPTGMNMITTIGGTGSVAYSFYTDDTNTLFGTGTPVGALTVNAGGNTTLTGPGPTVQPFSMTEVEAITLPPFTLFLNDISLQAAPFAAISVACAVSSGQVGIAYSSSVVVSGGSGPYKYQIVSGALPAGLSLDLNTGIISGKPTVAANYAFIVQVTDSNSTTAISSCGINVVPATITLSVSCPGATTATAGVAYNSSIVVTGGKAPYTFSSGILPNGLTLNSKTGAITGIPSKAGSWNFSVTVSDSSSPKLTATCNTCRILVSPATGNAPVDANDTATIGFWHNRNGQALILSLNGGSTSTALGNWLANTFPALNGPYSSYPTSNKSNAYVANLFMTFFNASGQKTSAQILAAALAVYVTDTDLAGTVAAQYGFDVSASGTGAKTFNVGTNGSAIGLSNNTSYTVLQLLHQVNVKASFWTNSVANAFNSIFSAINQTGDII